MDFENILEITTHEPEAGLELMAHKSSIAIEQIYRQRFMLSVVAASKLIPLKIKELESEFVIDLSLSALSVIIKESDRFNPNRLSVLFSESFSTTLPRELKIEFIRYCDWALLHTNNFKDSYISDELILNKFSRIKIGEKNLEESFINAVFSKQLHAEFLNSYLKLKLEHKNTKEQIQKI